MVECVKWRSPLDRLLNSDQFFFIAKKGGHVIFFGKPLLKVFQHHETSPPPFLWQLKFFWVTKGYDDQIFQSPQGLQ